MDSVVSSGSDVEEKIKKTEISLILFFGSCVY